jgi:hypothetical protein
MHVGAFSRQTVAKVAWAARAAIKPTLVSSASSVGLNFSRIPFYLWFRGAPFNRACPPPTRLSSAVASSDRVPSGPSGMLRRAQASRPNEWAAGPRGPANHTVAPEPHSARLGGMRQDNHWPGTRWCRYSIGYSIPGLADPIRPDLGQPTMIGMAWRPIRSADSCQALRPESAAICLGIPVSEVWHSNAKFCSGL